MRLVVLGLLLLVAVQAIADTNNREEDIGEGIVVDLERNPHTHERQIAMVNLLQRVHTFALSQPTTANPNHVAFPELSRRKHKKRRHHSRYGSDPIADADLDVEKNKISSVILLRNYFNTQFIGAIQISDKKKEMRAIFDTGSTNLWVNSVRCKTAGCKRHRQYNWRKSATFKKVGLPVMVRFGSGVLKGVVNREVVYLKGLEVPHQEIIEVKHQAQNVLNKGHYDSIVGLGLPRMAAHGFNPLFDNIMNQKILKHNLFSFYLHREMLKTKSKLIFGGIDHKLYEGKLHYHPVHCKTYWALDIDQILVGGKDIGICGVSRHCRGIIDSGTSFITGPSPLVKKLLANVRVAKGCENFKDLPPISFVIGGKEYSLDAWEYVLTVKKDKRPDRVYQHSDIKKIGHCAGLIMPLNLPGKYKNYWILGDLFMSKFYSVFDRDNMRIGLAPAKGQPGQNKNETAKAKDTDVVVQMPSADTPVINSTLVHTDEFLDFYGGAQFGKKDIAGMSFSKLTKSDDGLPIDPDTDIEAVSMMDPEQESDNVFEHVVKNMGF